MPRPNCQPRKRTKKNHGPDFVETSCLSSLTIFDGDYELLCDYCVNPAFSNPEGDPQELLICKDCRAKAHPSCMDYSTELAKKTLSSPWQCMSCKICTVCEDAENTECMLFCDSCDKGYHMSCHKPKIAHKPNGKWVCSKCNSESHTTTTPKTKTTNCSVTKVNKPQNEANNIGLPTPCDSPVSDFDGNTNSTSNDGQAAKKVPVLKDSALKQYPRVIPDAKDWTIDDVAKFLSFIGFSEQAVSFKEQEIDGKSLLLMKRSDVLTGMSLRLGPALKIYNHIMRLQTGLPVSWKK